MADEKKKKKKKDRQTSQKVVVCRKSNGIEVENAYCTMGAAAAVIK